MEKVRAECALFSIEKARVTLLASVLLKTIASSQSARGNFDSSDCKNKMFQNKDIWRDP